jgi:hypothetical protein
MSLNGSLLRAAGILMLGVTLAAETTDSLSVRIANETAPPGGMVQMKVLTTEVTPIFGGRPMLAYDPSVFSGVAGFAVAAPNGEAAGGAVIEGNHVRIFYSGTSLFTADYPILTVVLPVRRDAIVGSKTKFALDPLSTFDHSTLGSTTASIKPGTVTVGGQTSITDVVPGEGIWPAGTVVSVRGAGFDAKTSLQVNDAPVKGFTFVSPTELQFRLLDTFDVRGMRIVVKGEKNTAIYYAYMRGITSAVSARTLLAKTEPIFAVKPRTVATFRPSGGLSGSQYAALALQNPNMNDVNVQVRLQAESGALIHQATRTLASRHRFALSMSEILDGITPGEGTRVVVSASAPIDVFSLLCDEATWTVSPTLALESRP